MKNLIIASTILDIVEIVLLVICFGYYIKQYFFGDYIDELYKKFGSEMGEEDTYGNHITNGFEELFNNYQDFAGLGYLMLILLSFLDIFIIFIFLLSFMITYLCHLRSRSCCKCKRTCSYVSLIFAMILSIPFIVIACYAKSKINLTNEEIYQFDHDFNQKTKKNINFMKRRRIILIVSASLLYAV